MSDERVKQTCGCVTLALFLLLIIGITGLRLCCDGPVYSTGYRDGTIQKVSTKGVLFVTTEAEMALAGFKMAGTNDRVTGSNVFSFSITDPTIAKQIEEIGPNETVRIHYLQFWWSAFRNGQSKYRATRIEKAKN